MSAQRMQPLAARPWVVWLAVCVKLWLALAPTAAHALVWSQGPQPGYLDICSSPALSAASTPDSSGNEESIRLAVHCPFCLHPADRATLPPEPVNFLLLAVGPPPQTTRLLASFYAANVYGKAAPRGPPAFSFS